MTLSDCPTLRYDGLLVLARTSRVVGMAAKGGVLVACNAKHMPAAMLLPLELHFTQAERFKRQAHASLPTRKRLWQQTVRAPAEA